MMRPELVPSVGHIDYNRSFFMCFLRGMQPFDNAKISGMMVHGSDSAVFWISDAILRDERAFHIPNKAFLEEVMSYVSRESQIQEMQHGWPASRSDMECFQNRALELVESHGWSAVRPALSVTIRSWIIFG
ncbi:hypothetical protein OBBRIDRAFT_66295 [Obba rivulosa]|uniref:Uncharacterized protein n=1 Tax=Obba rivulosa TaxID=1052685 RepID=A0A8E2AQI0_9APHY|nr:hypothetical protein OBBRIDRAFT_66295 [Obba rivulosa]